MSVRVESYGRLEDGREVKKYTLANANGVEASFSDLGAIWTEMKVRDRDGNLRDVILGCDKAENLILNSGHLGAPVGRHANRIAGAKFTLNGVEYELTKNNQNVNNLHSGNDYWERRTWDVEYGDKGTGAYIMFSLHSDDMDQGFPGALDVAVIYTLSDDDSLSIVYKGISSSDTLFNMTNHVYFNLEGHDSGDITSQYVKILADYYTPADSTSIPTGEFRDVSGTPFDFREEKTIGRDIDAMDEQLKFSNGYDHNYALGNSDDVRLVATAYAEGSGIEMEVYTDLEGMQFYTGNGLHVQSGVGKGGAAYPSRTGYCFETQHFPDAIHHDNFISPILKAGEEFTTETIYSFSVRA